MFTGIVEGKGTVRAIEPRSESFRLRIEVGALTEGVRIGDSVAIDGTCLTVVEIDGPTLAFDVIKETLDRTAFADLRPGVHVNIERSMPADGRFHGHVVSGHVDGTGKITVKREEPGQTWVTVDVGPELTTFMIEKGSVTLSGVSLTLTEVTDTTLSVALIPHTLEVTTLGEKVVGSLLNIEVDIIGKYVHRLIGAYMKNPGGTPPGISIADIQRAGWDPSGGSD